MTHDLTDVLASTRVLLLDFDGPVCKIFSQLPAPTIAEQLSQLAATLTGDPRILEGASSDPIEVLRHVGTLDDAELLLRVEEEFRKAEVEAAHTAQPTPHAAQMIAAAVHTGRTVAIVSNNCAEAIETYLKRVALHDLISFTVARPFAAPHRMKPDSAELAEALATQGITAELAVLLGDSASDIEVAHTVGARSIAFANRLEKADRLTAAHPDVLLTGPDALGDVAAAYTHLRSR